MSEFKLKLRDARDRPATIQEHQELLDKLDNIRADTIEECARVAEKIAEHGEVYEVAAAIRELKDKNG